ncbi:MAG: YraN family protein [Pseudomonadota bacterium]
MTYHSRDFSTTIPDAVKADRGRRSYHHGCAAEGQVCARYQRAGYLLLATRWRAGRGELDLVFATPEAVPEDVVVVEVKSARDFDTALSRITPAKAQRLFSTTQQFLDTQPKRGLTECRIDVALVNQAGQIDIHENFFAGGI